MILILAARFGLSMALTAALTFGAAREVMPPPPPNEVTDEGPGAADTSSVPAGFVTVPRPGDPGTPLGPPPTDQLIQLVSFNKDAPPPLFGERAPWWTPAGIPRVEHITQFDGGPLQGVNSVPAAGAMLARLGYGIVTTASQLRSLHGGEGGISLIDLQRAVRRGWDAEVRLGVISPLMLRALMHAGAGAVIIVDYGLIPLNLQHTFDGAHALYLDSFRPGAGSGAEYYVMDPIDGPAPVHHGDWWPAEIIERAAMHFGGGAIATAWAFAGATTAPPASAPTGPALEQPIGDPGPAEPDGGTGLVSRGATEGGLDIDFSLGLCVAPDRPTFCPPGVPALYPTTASAPAPSATPLAGTLSIDLLYADTPRPGVSQIIFSAPAGVDPTFWYWPADGSSQALMAEPVQATLGGKQVWMVTVPIPQAGTFAFLAAASQAGLVSASEVGNISFGN